MKIKTLIILFLIVAFLASCAPGTATPTATITAMPTVTTAPTITPTPAPVTLSDLPELSTWVEEYVHAYDGKVSVNGVEMDAEQLTKAIRQNPETFTQTKFINGVKYSFVLVNGIPLVYQDEIGSWQEATMSKLGKWNGVEYECSLRLDARKYTEFLGISKKVFNENTIVVFTTTLDVTTVFGDFTEADWQRVLDDWDGIQNDFSSGVVPTDYPYYWKTGVDGMDADVVRAFGGTPQFRSQQLYETGLRPDGNRIEALRHFKAEKSTAEMLKLFEFVVRTRVLEFPQIKRWDVSDEVSGAYVMSRENHDVPVDDVIFWAIATGLTPPELTLKVAGWVKNDNPEAKTYITESNIFNTGNPIVDENYFFREFIPEIIKGNENHIIDGVIGENNWWIYEPEDWAEISTRIYHLNSNGLEIGGSETMIVSGDIPINDCCGRHQLVEIKDPELAQAEMYAQWVDLYLDKGIKTIGFGNIDDFYAWTQDVGLPGANPTLFDIDFRAKPAYYAIVQVLYEHLP
jgi:GH35 family endo-1,4-beta-xylanase